jgi:hypothetical protein
MTAYQFALEDSRRAIDARAGQLFLGSLSPFQAWDELRRANGDLRSPLPDSELSGRAALAANAAGWNPTNKGFVRQGNQQWRAPSTLGEAHAIHRAGRYLAAMPPSISGEAGHIALWRAALALVKGFALSPETAFEILRDAFNPRCEPVWTDMQLWHKVKDAAKARLETGYLLNGRGRP